MLKIYIHFLTKICRPKLFFDCGQKLFDLLAEKLRQGGENFIPRVQKNFRGSDFFGRKISSYHLRSLSGKYFDVCENFIFWSWSPLTFSETKFFCVWNFSSLILEFEQKFAHFPDKNFAGLSNFHTTSQTVFLTKK